MPLTKVKGSVTNSVEWSDYGYEVPVAFTSGIVVSRATQTITYGGVTYHGMATAIPFTTTGTFNPVQWEVISGVSREELAGSGGAGLVGVTAELSLLGANDGNITTASARSFPTAYVSGLIGMSGSNTMRQLAGSNALLLTLANITSSFTEGICRIHYID